jgi:chorismate dehydratase
LSVVRLGAVEYLNARPLVFGLEGSARFSLRFDVPSRCATLLHGGGIDVGLIPSIEYLRGPAEAGSRSNDGYRIVPGLAIASRGKVASVTIYTTRAIDDVRSIAMDTSSRTSVALARVICARAFKIQPEIHAQRPDLEAMLAEADAALIIGDNALFTDPDMLRVRSDSAVPGISPVIQSIDLGEVWTEMTGLPFVYAFWAGREGVLDAEAVAELQRAKEEGVLRPEEIVRRYFSGSPAREAAGIRYLRDNIKYDFGPDERAGLELFYRYAAEAGLVDTPGELRFY